MTTKLDLLEYFISHDPLKVLNGKIVDDDKIKYELVKNILEKFNKAEIIDEDWGILSKNGRKLYHPNIIEQLRPYISDPSKHILARRNAMEIAEACKLTELQNDLWRLVLDTNESIDIKEQAMSSLSKLVDDKHILEGMVKLAAIDNANDDNDRLKGYALNTTVETMYITTKQVFECITIPKNRHSLFGIYDLFLNYILPKKLEVQDIPFALPWVQKHIGERSEERRVGKECRLACRARLSPYL